MRCVYVYRNKINGKCYVGQTKQKLQSRYRAHLCAKDNYPFHNALRKYGRQNFAEFVLYLPEELTDLFEKEMMLKLNSIKPNGYNIMLGGGTCKKYHPETIEKIRRSRIGKRTLPVGYKMSDEAKKHLSEACKGRTSAFKGHIHKEKTKKEASARMKIYLSKYGHPCIGKACKAETRNKIAKANKGNQWNKGKKHTNERRKNISIAVRKGYENGRTPWNKGLKNG